jgi:hypothetical protein
VENFQLSIMIALDAIWCARNNGVHNGATPNFHSLLVQILTSIAIHLKAWLDKNLVVSWSPPSMSFLKLNFDATVRSTFMIVVAIISNHEGTLLLVGARKLPLLDINAGEARPALLAVEATFFFFFCSSSKFLLEGDSLVTILALNNPSFCTAWFSVGIIDDVISFFVLFVFS